MATQKFKLTINEDKVRVLAGPHTVASLKELTIPPVPPDHGLWLDIDGGADIQLDDHGTLNVDSDLVLYSAGPDGAHRKHVDIVIDGKYVVSENESVTGSILRRLMTPPIPSERDLYRDIDGAPDERIDDDEEVTLKKGAEFYSVPRLIAPGGSDAAA